MKKILTRSGLAVATVAIVLAGAAAFSAYEAHIVNVTATIENALSVDTGAMAFGTVFPQEYLVKDMNIQLSDSFKNTGRVDDVEYVIKQKPMVKAPCVPPPPVGFLGIKVAQATPPPVSIPCPDAPGDPYATVYMVNGQPTYIQPIGTGVTSMPAWQYCEENLPANAPYTYDATNKYWDYCFIPLSNYLSKHGSNPNDVSVDAFHQAYVWNNGVSDVNPAYIASGRLSKQDGVTSDDWKIDLAVPCFQGECAQDWASFVNKYNASATPASFILPQGVKGQTFGTQLWVEVTNISMCTVQTPHVIQSDTTDQVVATNGGTDPVSFPHAAHLVSNPNPGWTVGADIPGASWIWATDPTLPGDATNTVSYTFQKTFNWTGTTTGASLTMLVGADNGFEVKLNGHLVGSDATEFNYKSPAKTFTNLGSFINQGNNTLEITVTNMGLPNSTPSSNPAGLLYKINYTTTDACPN